MRNIKISIIILVLVLTKTALFSQDPTFTQFYANPLYLNPAFAGSHGCPRFSLNYRNEWPNLTGNYVTSSVSYDQYFKNISGGIGILATNDQQGKGTIQTSMLGLLYSYHVKVSRKFTLMFGARASWYQKTLDWDKLTFGDMIDPRKGFIYQTSDVPRGGKRGFFDASAGVVGYGKNFFAGLAVHHLNEPNESMIIGKSTLPMRFTAHMGANINVGRNSKFENGTSIMPNIIYQYQQSFQELCIGTYIKHNVFTTGIWFRNKDAFIISVGINSENFRIGYSYDVTISKLNNGMSHGSHEVSMGLNLKCKSKPVSFKTISCPSF